MARIERFEDIEAWQNARMLVKTIYEVTKDNAFSRDYGLKDQIQRAAVSIMSNIAEGFERRGNKEFIHYLYVSKASAGEVRSLTYVSKDIGYISNDMFNKLQKEIALLSGQIAAFIKYLKNNSY